jgi:hypothetical protein
VTTLVATDIDGDTDVDIVAGGGDFRERTKTILVLENKDGKGSFESRQAIDEPLDPGGNRGLYSLDLDNDGDGDILSALDAELSWYENENGDLGPKRIIATRGGVIFPVDVDRDGDIDIAMAISDGQGPRAVWYENVGMRVPGDSNQDGRFDRFDLVLVLQSGNYLTEEQASWREGDWNGDGGFDTNDVVTVLQAGTYQR